jgi:hypothetical protein
MTNKALPKVGTADAATHAAVLLQHDAQQKRLNPGKSGDLPCF